MNAVESRLLEKLRNIPSSFNSMEECDAYFGMLLDSFSAAEWEIFTTAFVDCLLESPDLLRKFKAHAAALKEAGNG